MSTERIYRLPEVRLMTGLGKTKIYAEMKQQKFPRQVPIGTRARGWLSTEIDAWIKERAAARS